LIRRPYANAYGSVQGGEPGLNIRPMRPSAWPGHPPCQTGGPGMKKLILTAAVAAATLIGGAAVAQPYGYSYSYSRGGYDSGYRYDNGYRYGGDYRYNRTYRLRDSDRDGIPDRAEWGRDRDRDGRPDQWDRYDNRRDRHHRRHHDRYDHYDLWTRW